MKLLDSLEERVDLMAKMQETRQRLQAHEPGEEAPEAPPCLQRDDMAAGC